MKKTWLSILLLNEKNWWSTWNRICFIGMFHKYYFENSIIEDSNTCPLILILISWLGRFNHLTTIRIIILTNSKVIILSKKCVYNNCKFLRNWRNYSLLTNDLWGVQSVCWNHYNAHKWRLMNMEAKINSALICLFYVITGCDVAIFLCFKF